METVKYYFHDVWEESGDPRTSQFPLLHGGPWKFLSIILFYVYFVKVIGPNFMRDRKPYDLRPWMLIYNGCMVGVNGVAFMLAMWLSNLGSKAIDCQQIDQKSEKFMDELTVFFGFIYTLIKLTDLGDLLFAVFRKRYDRITWYHIAIRISVPISSWFEMKYFPGGYSIFFPMTNVFVCFWMFSYYVLATCGPEIKQFLWWKKYLSMLQITQYFIIALHSLYPMYSVQSCAWPKQLSFIELAYSSTFFVISLADHLCTYTLNSNVKAKTK